MDSLDEEKQSEPAPLPVGEDSQEARIGPEPCDGEFSDDELTYVRVPPKRIDVIQVTCTHKGPGQPLPYPYPLADE